MSAIKLLEIFRGYHSPVTNQVNGQLFQLAKFLRRQLRLNAKLMKKPTWTLWSCWNQTISLLYIGMVFLRLFLTVFPIRYYFMQFVYTDKEWEGIVKVATERLARLAGHVKEKIFILHTFPLAYLNRKMINAALDNGSPIDWANVPNLPLATDMPKTQEKLNLIISTCTKCEQFDFTPRFLVNNTFYPYDPDYLIPYVNPGLHFTQPGLQRIRPLFTDICSRIGN